MADVKQNTKWEGWDEFVASMEEAAKNFSPNTRSAVVASCSVVETRAKTHHLAGATLNYGTHRLQRSVKSRVSSRGDKFIGVVGSPVVYAAIHEYGGVIRPKNSKYLTFQINGKWVRTTQVNMPARRWLSKSVEDSFPTIKKIFGKAVDVSFPGGDK